MLAENNTAFHISTVYMHKNSRWLIYIFFFMLLTGCSANPGNINLDSWLGNYTFSEPPVKTFGGYSMVMNWDLSVDKINDKYSAILNVNGQQKSFAVFNNLAGNDSVLFIICESTLNGVNEPLQPGDTLFSLLKITSRRIRTRWGSLQPILSESKPEECSCFIFTGTNKNNNTLKIPGKTKFHL
jgi:Family of unknown function (DUF5991)